MGGLMTRDDATNGERVDGSEAVRVLVVDDEQAILDLVSLGLRYEGFVVATATDGRAGLELAREFHPHLAILDVMMPCMDGFELCRALRGRETPGIIMLTAKDAVPDRAHGLELGADDYLTNPSTPANWSPACEPSSGVPDCIRVRCLPSRISPSTEQRAR